MNTHLSHRFDDPGLGVELKKMSSADLDDLAFGLIGFDIDKRVQRYNAPESRMAGLPPERVIGSLLFDAVAPCMNNYLVAQRFADAFTEDVVLDEVIAYVLTLRMKPIRVKLRLIAFPGEAMRYVLVERRV